MCNIWKARQQRLFPKIMTTLLKKFFDYFPLQAALQRNLLCLTLQKDNMHLSTQRLVAAQDVNINFLQLICLMLSCFPVPVYSLNLSNPPLSGSGQLQSFLNLKQYWFIIILIHKMYFHVAVNPFFNKMQFIILKSEAAVLIYDTRSFIWSTPVFHFSSPFNNSMCSCAFDTWK